MSAAVKDIALGSVILVACAALLAIAFTAPSPLTIDEESTTVAAATTPRRPAERPTVPAAPPEPPTPVIERPSPSIPAAITLDDVRQPPSPVGPVAPTTSDTPRTFDADDLTESSSPVAMADDEVDEPIARRWDDGADETPPTRSPRPDWRDAAEETTAAPDRSGQTRQHVVVSGETYQSISSQYYGTVRHWQRIQEANAADQHSLMPGMTLVIPVLDDAGVARASTPATTPEAATPAKGSGSTYVVRSGDSFYTIARDQLGNAQRYRELQELNGIDPYDLHVGMTIRLPAGGTAPTPAARPRTDAAAPAGSVIHVVERGEILGDISQRYYGTSRRWRAIADANGITDPQSLRVGQRLVIPDAAARTATVPSPSTSRPAATPTPTPAPTTERGEGVWHEVVRGDTLQLISQRYYGTTTRHPEILAANSGVNPNNLIVGARLWIPNAPPAAAPVRQPTPTPTPRTQPRDSGNDGGGRGPDWGSVLP